MYIIQVLIEHPVLKLDRPFTYLHDEFLDKYVRVSIHFNHQLLVGYVLDCKYTSLSKTELENKLGYKLAYITDVIDKKALLDEELVKLANRLKDYYLAPLISIYQTMLPKGLKPKSTLEVKEKTQIAYRIKNKGIPKTNQQAKLYAYLENKEYVLLSEMPYSKSVRDNLEKQGLIEKINVQVKRDPYLSVSHRKKEITLTNDQKRVVEGILKDTRQVCLLHGVTGSGKTEVYIELTRQILSQNKTVIVLVPEIALTPMMIEQFKDNFDERVAIFHSRLSSGERYDEYLRIKNQEVQVVVGARSAIFAPLKNIGLIILDEEHDASYKQSSMFMYHTHQVARMRSKDAKIVLGSATPSIESYAKAISGKYGLYELKNRINQKPLPKIELVNMLEESKVNYRYLSRKMEKYIDQALKNNHQVILLLNRRGYAPHVICEDCGQLLRCPDCDVTLTYHKEDNTLKCHYCNFSVPYQNTCPSCHNHHIKMIGFGTQKMEEYIMNRFNNYKVLRYDFDTTSKKNSHMKLLDQFRNNQAQILLGTQMIAKGLDFPGVEFVGVINADSSLVAPDFRANEQTFQLLTQVAGRSGRQDVEGHVLIQTYNPDHYVLQCVKNHDYQTFFKKELHFRKKLFYPPYCFLVCINIQGKNEGIVIDETNKLYYYLKRYETIQLLGPTKANVYRLKDLYRMRIVIKYTNRKDIHTIFNNVIEYFNVKENRVSIGFDFNPYSLL